MILIAVKRSQDDSAVSIPEVDQKPMEAYTVTIPEGSGAYETVIAFLARKNLPVNTEIWALDLSKVTGSLLHYRLESSWVRL